MPKTLSTQGGPEMKKVEIYGADWCGDTKKSLEVLDRLNVQYDYTNIDDDAEAAEWVKQQNGGKELKPTVKIGDVVLSMPSASELEKTLRQQGVVD
jgi:glutaredoxin